MMELNKRISKEENERRQQKILLNKKDDFENVAFTKSFHIDYHKKKER